MKNIDSYINKKLGKIENHIHAVRAYIARESDDAQTIAEMHRRIVKQNNTIRQLEYELYLERKH